MGKFQQQVSQLLDREIDRKQFLQYSGAIFLAAFGVTGLINAVLHSDKHLPSAPTAKTKNGYSSARYNR